MKTSTITTILALSFFVLSGCMPRPDAVSEDIHKDEVNQALNTPSPDFSETGSLWAGGGVGLLTDPKANRVGDLVTVLVQENASATRSLGTKKDKSSSRKTGLSAMLGYETSLSAANPNFKPATAIDLSDSKSFDGSGSTNNSDTLTASVTSVVTKVYDNGNMYIIGRRLLTINHQPQEITFSGIIRPNDISAANTIQSSKVAQAKISYGGGGELATVAHEGWLSQSLDQIWPF